MAAKEAIVENKKPPLNGKKVEMEKNIDGKIEKVYYERLEELGHGGFGTVYKYKTDKNEIAGKIIKLEKFLEKGELSLLYNEINIQKSFNRPDIVKVIDYKQDNEYFLIFLELCENGSLKDLLKKRTKLTEKEVLYFMLQIIIALNFLHNKFIIHRDLKLSNIFLDKDMKIKIGDFGLAKVLHKNQKLDDFPGTKNFMAPELFNKIEYSYEADIWALGIIMCYLLTGIHPFGEKENRIKDKEIKPNIQGTKGEISKAAKDLIRQILEKDPSKRPTLNQIIYHDFFNREIPKHFSNEIFNKIPDDFSKEISDKDVVMKNLISIVRPTIKGDILFDEIHEINDLKKNDDINDISIYVKTYLNYNERFGVGYLLNNGDAGVYFKDNTILLINKNHDNYYYINKNEKENFYSKDNIPENMNNKIKILNGFIKYFDKHNTENDEKDIIKEGTENAKTEENETIKNEEKKYIYAKNVIIDKKCVILKLINEVEHIFFADNVEIIMSRDENILTYIEKDKTKTNLKLNTSIDNPCRELRRRIKYIQYVNIDFLSKKMKKSNSRKETE